jgi:L-threonylcarbamoyladenylate synthase
VSAGEFERCIRDGGVAVFPADTVYGLACDPDSAPAVQRLYALKCRAAGKPAAVMFFELSRALHALPELGRMTRGALERLLPGAVTVLLPNPSARFPLACAGDTGTLGLRVAHVPSLAGVGIAVLQSSANIAGGAEPRRIEEVLQAIRAQADLVLDGGELPGTASTVVDLRSYEHDRSWRLLRRGAVGERDLAGALGPLIGS